MYQKVKLIATVKRKLQLPFHVLKMLEILLMILSYAACVAAGLFIICQWLVILGHLLGIIPPHKDLFVTSVMLFVELLDDMFHL